MMVDELFALTSNSIDTYNPTFVGNDENSNFFVFKYFDFLFDIVQYRGTSFGVRSSVDQVRFENRSKR